MSSREAAARCGRLELVASRGTIDSKPLAKASWAVARMQTFVFTPAMTTVLHLLLMQEEREVGGEEGAVAALGDRRSRARPGLEPAKKRSVGGAGEMVVRQLPPLEIVEAGWWRSTAWTTICRGRAAARKRSSGPAPRRHPG